MPDDPIFDESKMLKLVESDRYLAFVFKDLKKKGLTESNVLEVLFNSEVLDDSVMTDKYNSL